MRNSCAVCSLAVVLCLVVCVSASTTVTQAEATAAVEQAQRTVTTVRERAQKEFDDAQIVLQKVESSKSAAEIAASKSQATANDNEEAKAIAANIQSLSDEVVNFHSEAKQKLDTAVSTLTKLLASAKDLEGKTSIEITPNAEGSDDYTVTNGKATTLKEQATALDGRINTAVQPIAGFDSTANDMVKKAKQAQLKDAHVSAIVAVATIESMLANANTIIGQIEEKRNKVSGIVEEMKTFKTNPTAVSDENIKALHTNAANALRDATGAVDNANNARTVIQTQKNLANEVLTKVKPETIEVNEAQGEVRKAEACIGAAEKSFLQLQSEPQIADNSVTNANEAKDNLKTAVSTDTSATRPEQSVTNSEVKQLQDSVRTAVNTIQSIMEEADGTLQETTNNKDAVHDIVEEMKTLSTTEFIEANQNIKMLHNKADDALTDATGAVQKAEKAKTDITEEKQKADDALSSLSTATDVETAREKVNTVNACVNQANQFAAILNNALQTAKDSVTNANDAKQKLQTALSTATSATHTEQSSTHSQVQTLKGSVSSAVTEIQTMIGEAVRIIQQTENHKQTVYDIVEEMKTLKTTAKIESNDIIKLCKNAEGELTKATGAVEKVKTEKEAMRQEKIIADAALKDVNAATDTDKAQQQADTATSCLDKVKKNLSQLRIALQTAKSTVEKANDLKQKLKTALSTTTTAPSTEQNTQRKKSDIPDGDGTGTDQKDTTIQPTSKDSLAQSNSSTDELKDALIKDAQNVPTTALTGEKAPAPGAKNDSAMTVSVPLLVALIASAVLQ